MNEFIKIKKEAVFLNTQLEMKENLSYNLKNNNIELKGKAFENQKYKLFGYVDFEEDERKYRYKNKVTITLKSAERTNGVLLISGIEVSLNGGIQVPDNSDIRMSESQPYPEKTLDLKDLKWFIVESIVDKLNNELITEQEKEKFRVKKIFIKEDEILLEDIRGIEAYIKNASIPIFN